jgi:glycosyltransferase involved in cell wall biosynthesis
MFNGLAAAQKTAVTESNYRSHESTSRISKTRIRVFLMDLWCYTPHYDRYLYEGLVLENLEVTLGSVCSYQDPEYFAKNGVHNDPGFVDLVPKLRISNDMTRRMLMLVESCINMLALLVRFSISRPHIVHVQWTPLVRRLPFEIWFLKLLKLLQIRLVYTAHNVLPHDTGRRYLATFKRLYKEMDAIICHTDEAKSRLVREFAVDPEQVRVIAHGPLLHDARRYSVQLSKARLLLPEDKALVLWQGIVRPYKGLDFLLQAWSKVEAHDLKACLLIAGTGDSALLESIKEHVARLGLHESVRLDFRFVPDEELAMYYQAADILVYPYSEVTTSGALMTALAYRKAIVATNLPAFREILRDQETALLVDYGDVENLASSLSRLIRTPEERNQLAFRVASSGGVQSWRNIAKQTRQCYDTVLYESGWGEA